MEMLGLPTTYLPGPCPRGSGIRIAVHLRRRNHRRNWCHQPVLRGGPQRARRKMQQWPQRRPGGPTIAWGAIVRPHTVP